MTILDPEKWSALPPGTNPLSGNEIMAMVQSGQSVQIPLNYVGQPGASYLLLTANNYLHNSRILTAGSGISLTDGGPGEPLTISATGGGGNPGGIDGSVQFKAGSSFAGSQYHTWDDTNQVLSLSSPSKTGTLQSESQGTLILIGGDFLSVTCPTIVLSDTNGGGGGSIALFAGTGDTGSGGTLQMAGGSSTTGNNSGGGVIIDTGAGSGSGVAGLLSLSTAGNIHLTFDGNGTWLLGSGFSTGTPGQVITSQGAGLPAIWATAGGGSGTPGGISTQIQYNVTGNFTADPGNGFKWVSGSGSLTLSNTTDSTVSPGTAASTTSNGHTLNLRGGAGGSTSGDGGTLALSGGITTLGAGGDINLSGGNGAGASHSGGGIELTGGQGGTTSSGGGNIFLLGGSGGTVSGDGGGIFLTAGIPIEGNGGVINLSASNAVTSVNANLSGGQIEITAGASTGTSVSGGAITISAGKGSPVTGVGGSIAIQSGDGGSTSGDGGQLNLTSGNGSGTSHRGGSVILQGGNGSAITGGGGQVNIVGGTGGATSGDGGSVAIEGGSPQTSGNGGSVSVIAGSASGSNNNGAGILIQAGSGTGSGSDGGIQIKATGAGSNAIIDLDIGASGQIRMFHNGVQGFGMNSAGNITLSAPTSGQTLKVAPSPSAGELIATSANLTDGAGGSAGTLGTAPSAGNPTKWIKINDNGTIRSVPAW